MRIASKTIMGHFLGYWAIGLAAGVCFKEGGTDSGHRLLYFLPGNVLGVFRRPTEPGTPPARDGPVKCRERLGG
jgi:hypothetical protein